MQLEFEDASICWLEQMSATVEQVLFQKARPCASKFKTEKKEHFAFKHLLSTGRAVWKREASWCVIPARFSVISAIQTRIADAKKNHSPMAATFPGKAGRE